MNLTIQNTDDGSKTIYSEAFKETYHSVNGAITESMHVFINTGFNVCKRNPMKIFEVGFGTGLNALLTLQEAKRQNIAIEYDSIELYPLESEVYNQLAYCANEPDLLKSMHDAPWEREIEISSGFLLHKMRDDLVKFYPTDTYDLVYFDAFSPVTQPELWTEEVFEKIFAHMNNGGILTTYCAKGVVRRTLEKVGFKTERLPGPPGKREILRARKEI